MDWGRVRSFIWGGLLGGLVGFVLSRLGRASAPAEDFRVEADDAVPAAFRSAPCYGQDDGFV